MTLPTGSETPIIRSNSLMTLLVGQTIGSEIIICPEWTAWWADTHQGAALCHFESRMA